jgi:hypothetical protein
LFVCCPGSVAVESRSRSWFPGERPAVLVVVEQLAQFARWWQLLRSHSLPFHRLRLEQCQGFAPRALLAA